MADYRASTIGEGEDINPDPWDQENNLLDIEIQIVHFIFWFIVLILIELKAFKCKNCCQVEVPIDANIVLDEDVQDEVARVQRKSDEDFAIKVEGLRKVYSVSQCFCFKRTPVVAVENLSFGLNMGECFALLGVNGAGKSTTFKTLTTEIEPTEGSITIANEDISSKFENIKKLMGYCPQQNTLVQSMTVDEHLHYFCDLKGFPPEQKQALIDETVSNIDLTE